MDKNVVELKWPYSEAVYTTLHTGNSAAIYIAAWGQDICSFGSWAAYI
jgi:hypothetical protein